MEKFAFSLSFSSVLDFFYCIKKFLSYRRDIWFGGWQKRLWKRQERETKSFDYFSPSSSSTQWISLWSDFKENITNGIIMFLYYKNVITFMTQWYKKRDFIIFFSRPPQSHNDIRVDESSYCQTFSTFTGSIGSDHNNLTHLAYSLPFHNNSLVAILWWSGGNLLQHSNFRHISYAFFGSFNGSKIRKFFFLLSLSLCLMKRCRHAELGSLVLGVTSHVSHATFSKFKCGFFSERRNFLFGSTIFISMIYEHLKLFTPPTVCE